MDIVDVNVDIPQRIKSIYASCSKEEQAYLLQILQELSESDIGYSKTYESIWLADYKEIPVDINTFMNSETYLGKTNRCGEAVFPFWRTELNNVFSAGNKYHEWVLTGATRIGKSSTAITATAYMLYRLMCLRDPQKFFGKKEISKFSILFFNITKELAKGVAYREFNDTLRESPWFNAHGTFSKSEQNFYYIPEGGKVVIDYGSDASHGLGKQVFVAFMDECVVGDTTIVTDTGEYNISDLENQVVNILQYDFDTQSELYVPATVVKTKDVDTTIKLTLEDGSIFEGTPNHKVMLSDGSYKELQDLTITDKFVSIDLGGLSICKIETIHHETPIPVYDVVNAQPFHNFVAKCNTSKVVFHNCNFSQAGVKDVNKAKAHMRETYNTLAARVKGTFKHGGEVFGKIFAVSSKRSDSDFMEAYVEEQLNAGAGDHMYISDAPQWEVLPASTFSKETFCIAIGDRYHRGFVVPDNQCHESAIADLKAQGYKILNPPIDMKSDFLADFDVALRDLAGISVVGAMSFITQEAISACIGPRRNPFYSDVLQIGTKDNLTIEEFFHINEVPPELKRVPIFIHLDLSLNGDKTGISAGGITKRVDIETQDGNKVSQPFLSHLFSVAIEAPRGANISYSKIFTFICWLRKVGFHIERISRDQFQSEYLAQMLEEKGFKVDKLSLDRTPDGYIALRSVLIEQRIDMLDHSLLQNELVLLQRDAVTGKCDHPAGGCFTIDTKIQLVDGRTLTIGELLIEQEYKTNYVYTVNEKTLLIEPKPIKKIFQTKLVTELVKVTLDNDEVIYCTPDHRFMKRDGSYEEIQNMSVGTSLMSLYLNLETGLPGGYVYDKPCKKLKEYHNHKIKSIEYIHKPCRVYDLEIEDNHNFALEAGVFVHNSKDVADSHAGWVWNALLNNPGIPIKIQKVANAISTVNSVNSRYKSPLANIFPNMGLRK